MPDDYDALNRALAEMLDEVFLVSTPPNEPVYDFPDYCRDVVDSASLCQEMRKRGWDRLECARAPRQLGWVQFRKSRRFKLDTAVRSDYGDVLLDRANAALLALQHERALDA